MLVNNCLISLSFQKYHKEVLQVVPVSQFENHWYCNAYCTWTFLGQWTLTLTNSSHGRSYLVHLGLLLLWPCKQRTAISAVTKSVCYSLLVENPMAFFFFFVCLFPLFLGLNLKRGAHHRGAVFLEAGEHWTGLNSQSLLRSDNPGQAQPLRIDSI